MPVVSSQISLLRNAYLYTTNGMVSFLASLPCLHSTAELLGSQRGRTAISGSRLVKARSEKLPQAVQSLSTRLLTEALRSQQGRTATSGLQTSEPTRLSVSHREGDH